MAEIEILHFHPGTGPLHRLDPRLKVVLLIAYIAGILSSVTITRGIIMILLWTGSIAAGLRLLSFRRELKVFTFLALVILVSKSLGSASGTLQGALFTGLSEAWRFLLIVWSGILFTAVTDPAELHSVIYWALKPLPKVPAGRLAAQASFTIVMLPLMLDSVHEIREARKARGIEGRKNPIYRLRSLINPLLEKLLLQMEEFSLALEARCFDEDVQRYTLRISVKDLLRWAVFVLPAVLVVTLNILAAYRS